MVRVAIFNNIRLPDSCPLEIVGLDQNPEAILVRSEDLKNKILPDSLYAICRVGSGIDNIPVEKCTEKGIAVFNTPGANANSVKELVVWALIEASRKASIAAGAVKENWGRNIAWEKEKKKYAGTEIADKKILVIGLGNVGSMVANACLDLGMDVYGYDPCVISTGASRIKTAVLEGSDSNIGEYDFITLHPSLNKATRNIISVGFLERLKQGVIILNFARKEMVDDRAMKDALEKGWVRMYVSDFVDCSFSIFLIDRLVMLPHLGASTIEAQQRALDKATGKILDFINHGRIEGSLNFPDCNPGIKEGGRDRIVVVNKNIPGMIGEYSGILGKGAVNISHFVNENREKIGYSVMDVDAGSRWEVDVAIDAIKSQDGILKIRVI
ncbi:MAG: 3-phosphoglycerate dehydrogenase [Candidatus Yanofskybacteria bacterium]|nr:3-phosphoglycerate dehydrogenase [Candidatus Yanofskybacteria bacterium]